MNAGRLLILAVVLVAALASPAVAGAAIPPSLVASCAQRDAADADTGTLQLPFFFCDDGVPEAGGRDPNVTGDRAVTVPAAYDGFAGLPGKSATAAATPGANPDGDVALDADLSFPDPDRFAPPPGGYPIVVFMHGCCSGSKTGWEAQTIDEPANAEKWHYSNAWFASRGYVVLTYTSRGFVAGKGPTDPDGDGSTGETQIDHRAFEVNDLQSLVAQIADTTFTVGGRGMTIDPSRVVTTGGSYGGGLAWLAMTDPDWTSPGGRQLRLAATAPRYGWTDLAYSLVPNGRHREGQAPPVDGSGTTAPLGFPKRTVVAGLYATGQSGATFPALVTEAFLCLQSPLPAASNPQCASVIRDTLPSFIADRSAYYQNDFFAKLASGATAPVPLFSAGTLTDPLFPGREHRRMVERLKSVRSDYPVQEYYGDFQHFVQNKRKEWADLCGQRTCSLSDQPGGDLNANPAGVTRTGVTTRLNRFIDSYVKPQGNPSQGRPARDVTTALQICPSNASDAFPADGPGETFTASSFAALAPNELTVVRRDAQRTTSTAAPNQHALNADPLLQTTSRGGSCPVDQGPAGPGVAVYESPRLERSYTMIGPTRVRVPFEGEATELQLNARMYDVGPDGSQTMVDRGFLTLANAGGGAAPSPAVFDLIGNAWRFPRGHTIRVELAQDDDPYLKRATVPSSLTLGGATLEIPVREASARIGDVGSGGDDENGGSGGGGSDDDEAAGGGSGGGGSSGGGSAPAGSAGAGGSGGGGGGLPFTGLALATLALTGAGLAVAGAAVRRRLSARRA